MMRTCRNRDRDHARAPAPRRQPPRRPIAATERLESRTLMAAVTDDFNDNNDAGWAHYAPLAALGAPGTYELVDGTYRITADESPAPEQAGPGRAGSFRPDATYADFRTSIDIVDWNPDLDQAFGILARVATPGLGTTNGYALSYSTDGDLDISLVTGEAPDDLDPSVDIFLEPGKDYRLVFEGRGARLLGFLYDLADLTKPVARTSAVDATYASGMNGIFVYANTSDGLGTADATFDNFSADVAPPRDPTVAYWRFEDRPAGQEFPPPSSDGGDDSGLAADSAGGDDALRTYSEATNPVYVASVPAATVPGTGAANTAALDFNPQEDLYTAQAGDLNDHTFHQFTIEASFNFDTIGWMNVVGKDGKPRIESSLAPLQFKLREDTGVFQIEILDAAGNERQVSTLEPIQTGRWYNAAAVNDGQTLSLYLDDTTDAEGYVLQGQVAVSGGLYRSNATWTVGRGANDGNLVDWVDGKIDEVRISDDALTPDKFLFAPSGTSLTHVTQVFVNGPNLTGSNPEAGQAAFRTAAGVDPVYGYPVPAGANQLLALPWVDGIDRVAIRFDSDVAGQLAQGDLAVRSSGGTPATVTGFTYDPVTRTGVWTLNSPVTRDKLRLILDDAGIAGLDGDWNNGADTFPSGDGTAGGDFSFRLNILAGDTNQDGIVSALDVADVKRRLSRRAGDGSTGTNGYSIFTDVNGDGIISALDLAAVKQRLTRRIDNLPEPASALLFA